MSEHHVGDRNGVALLIHIEGGESPGVEITITEDNEKKAIRTYTKPRSKVFTIKSSKHCTDGVGILDPKRLETEWLSSKTLIRVISEKQRRHDFLPLLSRYNARK